MTHLQQHSNEERQYLKSLITKNQKIVLGSSGIETETTFLLPTTDEPFVPTTSSSERGLTESETAAAWALVEDINRFVVLHSDDEFYLEPRWVNEKGFVYRMRDGHNGSTLFTVPQGDLPLFSQAVDKRRCNPYDAIGDHSRWCDPRRPEIEADQLREQVEARDAAGAEGWFPLLADVLARSTEARKAREAHE